MTDVLKIRAATLEDILVLIHHRRAMFHDMGFIEADALDKMSQVFEVWVAERMQRGEYMALLVTNAADETVIGGADLWLLDWPPSPTNVSCRRAYVFNVYTRPAYRRRGLARQLMTELIGWCRAQGIKTIGLHASDEGRPLYESLGFTRTSEMQLTLE